MCNFICSECFTVQLNLLVLSACVSMDATQRSRHRPPRPLRPPGAVEEPGGLSDRAYF